MKNKSEMKTKPIDVVASPSSRTLRLEMMPLSELTKMAHQRNPKDHDIDSLIDSFKRFGFTAAPTIDEATMVMVAGHGRCEALAKMRNNLEEPPPGIGLDGIEWLVPVMRGISFASERERDAYVIADNQNVMAGGWKFDVLAQLVGELKADGGFAGLGFQEIELNALLGQLPPEAPDNGMDPEANGSSSSNRPDPNDGSRGRTEITARIECPKCGHMIER